MKNEAQEHPMRGRSVAHRAMELIDGIVLAVCALLILAIAGLVVAAVFMRYGLGRPITYSFDLSTLLFAWAIFLGLYLAERSRSHLAVDLLDHALPPTARHVLFLLRQIALAGLSLFFAWIGWQLVQRAGMDIPSLRISIRWLYAPLPIGFVLLALAQLAAATRWRDPPEPGSL